MIEEENIQEKDSKITKDSPVCPPGDSSDDILEKVKETIVLQEPRKSTWRIRKLAWTWQERMAYDLVSVCLMIVVIYLLFHFVVGTALVNGSSMYPTLQNNQLVLFNRLNTGYQVGDVVAVRMPSGEFYVKRIVAKAGDVVELREGKLYVNDVEVEEPYVFGDTLPEEGNVEYPLTVEEGKYFILGDNREKSNDSRAFGSVIKERITGKVIFYAGILQQY
ncbi:MAG: signal peptidase I [Lachnospiraceae bacterium]|nr:signal peptidase I [Lachnospiraceae bacterium]